MMWILPVSSKGQITLPLAIRQSFGINGRSKQVMVRQTASAAIVGPLSPYSLNDLYGMVKRSGKGVRNLEKLIEEGITEMAKRVAEEGVE